MSGKYVLNRSDNQFTFTFTLSITGAAPVLLTSPRYARKESAQEGIAAVRRSAGVPFRFRRRRSSGGERYFVLQASTGKVIGTSSMYASTSEREQGIAAVRRYAAAAPLEDQTPEPQ